MAEDTENIAEEKKGPSAVGMALMGTIIAIVGIAIGVLGSDYIMGDEETPQAVPADGSEAAAAAAAPINQPQTLPYDLGEFNVNLKDPATLRILQMNIVLECDNSVRSVVEGKQAQLQDAIIMLASEYTVGALSGMEGKIALRDEIQLRINAILGKSRVERVYFTKFIIGK